VWGLDAPLLARVCSMFGQTVEKAAVRWSRVLVSVVIAWPKGGDDKLYLSTVFLESRDEGGISRFSFDLGVATKLPAKAVFHDDEGALFSFERGWLWGGVVRDPSCVDEVRSCARTGLEHTLSLFRWKDPIRYSAGGRCTLGVSVASGETPVAVSRVLYDVGVVFAASVLYCW